MNRLASIHSQGYIHRDLKPANVVIGNDTSEAHFIYLIDFGLAKMVDDGMRVVFEKVNGVDKSYIHNPVNDTTTPMTRANNTYSIGLTVPKYSQDVKKRFKAMAREHNRKSKEQGFPRRA